MVFKRRRERLGWWVIGFFSGFSLHAFLSCNETLFRSVIPNSWMEEGMWAAVPSDGLGDAVEDSFVDKLAIDELTNQNNATGSGLYSDFLEKPYQANDRASPEVWEKVGGWPNPVLVVGMPKAGTSSIAQYFKCGGIDGVYQFRCEGGRFCGTQVQSNLKNGRSPLFGTGRGNVYAQLDVEFDTRKGRPCYFPQVDALEALHQHHPASTLILNTRNLDDWVESLNAWKGMSHRLAACNISGFQTGVGMTTQELHDFYKQQIQRIRTFVKSNPSHRLVEVAIDQPNASAIMYDNFGINVSCWGHHNPRRQVGQRPRHPGRRRQRARAQQRMTNQQKGGTGALGIPSDQEGEH